MWLLTDLLCSSTIINGHSAKLFYRKWRTFKGNYSSDSFKGIKRSLKFASEGVIHICISNLYCVHLNEENQESQHINHITVMQARKRYMIRTYLSISTNGITHLPYQSYSKQDFNRSTTLLDWQKLTKTI